MGVEIDSYHRPLAYWIRDRHPSEYQFRSPDSSESVRRYPADEIIHLRVLERWPQVRGVPWLHAVARKLNDMDGYSEAEIIAARAAACYVGAYESPVDPMGDPTIVKAEDGSYETELSPAMILNPPQGKKFSLYSPNRPNTALDPFMRYMLREIAAGTGPSYESLSRDYSQSNYSSSRLALLDDRDLWRVLQMWFIRSFRDIVHRAWLRQAVLAKQIKGISVEDYAIEPARFEAVRFKPRGWGWVDPTKEVAAYKEAIRGGLTTRTHVIAATADGRDVEDVDDERRQEIDSAQQKGLQFDTDPGAGSGNSSQGGLFDDDDDADGADEEQGQNRLRAVK